MKVSSINTEEEIIIQVQLKGDQKSSKKRKRRGTCFTPKSRKKKKVKPDWRNFQNDELTEIGRRAAQNKTGYEYGVNYNFRHYCYETDWNKIVEIGLGEERGNLVPFTPK